MNINISMFNITECSHEAIFSINETFRCQYILTNCNGDYYNFYKIPFCYFQSQPYFSIPLILLILFCLLFFISEPGSKEVSYPLEKIVSYFNINQNIAGLTFLAIGNGAPDIISSLVACADIDGLNLTMGALFGAGCFTTCIVLGTVIIVAESIKVNKEMFLRDIIIYLLGALWISYIFKKGEIKLFDAIVFVGLYCANVVVAMFQLKNKQIEEKRNSDSLLYEQGQEKLSINSVDSNIQTTCIEMTRKEVKSCFSFLKEEYFQSKEDSFSAMTLPQKIFYIFYIFPLSLLKRLTIPEIRDTHFNRVILVLSPFCSFLFVILVLQKTYLLYQATIMLPILFLLVIISFLFCKFGSHKGGKLSLILCPVSFCLSLMWVWFTATNLVDILKMIGIVLNIPESFVGMTLLAFGNSICDLSLNAKLAKTGFAEMAASGSIAGPMFNLLMGLGLGLLRTTLTIGTVKFNPSIITVLPLVFLVFNLIRIGIQAKINNYTLKRSISFIGYITYLIFAFAICYYTFIRSE